jgi:hypothetical protein
MCCQNSDIFGQYFKTKQGPYLASTLNVEDENSVVACYGHVAGNPM